MISKLPIKNTGIANRSTLFLFLLLILLKWSCTDSNRQAPRPEQIKYFDLKGYFELETIRIKAAYPRVRKKATVDGVEEERVLEHPNFDQELNIFSNADINRPAWSDKYIIDSVFNEQRQLVRLNYAAKDDDLRTKKISIDFEDGHISKIFIENNTRSTIADTKQLLIYQPEMGYTIESRQKVTTSGDNTFLVEVQFLKD